MPDPKTIDFWFDASCPFTWRTANWARHTAGARSVEVRWHLMSLYKLNEGKEIPEQYRSRMDGTRRVMRVLAAAQRQAGPGAVEPLYFAIGRRLHEEGREPDAELFRESLAEAGLPAELAGAADDPANDEAVYASHAEGQAAMGEESGSPVLAFGGTQAFFGPVFTAVPAGDDAVALLDALMSAAAVAEFTELKRSRQGAGAA